MAKSKRPKALTGKSQSKAKLPSAQPSRTTPQAAVSRSNAPTWTVNDDRKSAMATFSDNPPLSLHYDVAAVEDLQKILGLVRGAMAPEVGATPAENEQIAAVANPSWVIRPAGAPGDCLLQLRDPRYGWLHYLIPKDEAAKLLNFLRKQVGAGA